MPLMLIGLLLFLAVLVGMMVAGLRTLMRAAPVPAVVTVKPVPRPSERS